MGEIWGRYGGDIGEIHGVARADVPAVVEDAGEIQGRYRGDAGEIQTRYRGDTGEMQGRCRGDAGEMQGRCRGDTCRLS